MINRLALSLLLLTLSACSIVSSKKVPVSGADFTVLNVSNQYIKSLIAGEAEAVNRMIHWESYSSRGSERRELLERIASFKEKGFAEAESLKTLKLKVIDVDNNDAVVELEKIEAITKKTEEESEVDSDYERKQAESYFTIGQKVRLELLWDGSRWLVTEDNVL